MSELKQKALRYHQFPRPGKLAIRLTKPMNKETLVLAYTPYVAAPCEEIQRNPAMAYEYTSKPNLVAVITNGTAVLGLGDIGALAGKPVMEGKAALFKYLAGIDAIDIEINEKDPKMLACHIKAISDTFGGINLEDVKAPECFEVSEKLQNELQIPFFHDDQYGTAVVVVAALKNALEIVQKHLSNVKIVLNGAGAAAIACADLCVEIGVKIDNIYMFDSQGLITHDRNVNDYKKKYAQKKNYTLREALDGADVFVGLSKANILQPNDIQNMAENPIIFAMANPIPEIMPDIARQARPDAIVGSGRSDFPNQINNVLCFPFLFRGALDVRATKITRNMLMACCNAISNIAKQNAKFGKDFIVPSAFDPTLVYLVSEAVAKAAIADGVATIDLPENYYDYLDSFLYGENITATTANPGNYEEET
jgi:malate dehydrogenase (oxaloacetate-decarboxylating)(NADP+)